MTDNIKAWFFSRGFELANGDGRKIALGVTHEVEPPIVPCRRGLHASVNALDALQYAPGGIVWRVTLSGEVVRNGDKHVASCRTYDAGGIDVSDTLRVFARSCALDVTHLWGAHPVVVKYLTTGDESLRDAARGAARDAAWGAQNERLTQMLDEGIRSNQP